MTKRSWTWTCQIQLRTRATFCQWNHFVDMFWHFKRKLTVSRWVRTIPATIQQKVTQSPGAGGDGGRGGGVSETTWRLMSRRQVKYRAILLRFWGTAMCRSVCHLKKKTLQSTTINHRGDGASQRFSSRHLSFSSSSCSVLRTLLLTWSLVHLVNIICSTYILSCSCLAMITK